MAIFFVKTATIIAAPNNTNDGRDPIGFALATATWTSATKVLVKTGAFTSYTYTADDVIYIASATAGTNGLYVIASKESADQITLGDLVDGAGIASDQTDVTSSNGPHATIAYSATTSNAALVSGDTVRICNDASHTHNTASITLPLKILGFTARGGLPQKATIIQDQAGTDNTTCFSTPSNVFEVTFRNLIINGGGIKKYSTGIQFGAGSRGQIYDCEFIDIQGTLGWGITPVTGIAIRDCIFNNCKTGIFGAVSAPVYVTDCVAVDCTASGFDHVSTLHRCVAYNCVRGFLNVARSGGSVTNCVAFNNTNEGFSFNSANPGCRQVFKNVAANNQTHGYLTNSNTPRFFAENAAYNNTSGHADGATGDTAFQSHLDGGNLTSDPVFVDTAAADFRISTTSALWGLGYGIGDEPAAAGPPPADLAAAVWARIGRSLTP